MFTLHQVSFKGILDICSLLLEPFHGRFRNLTGSQDPEEPALMQPLALETRAESSIPEDRCETIYIGSGSAV